MSILARRDDRGAAHLHRNRRIVPALAVVGPLLTLICASAAAADAPQLFDRHCTNCHAAGFPSPASRDALRTAISAGRPSAGMPAFGRTLAASDIDALSDWIHDGMPRGNNRRLGSRIHATELDTSRSNNYAVASAETLSNVRYVGNIDSDSMLCYDDVDLTGVKSIEFDYARGDNGEPGGRIAILIAAPSGLGPRTNIGEKSTRPTGGWEDFVSERAGLARPVEGRHLLCFFGLEGGGIFNLRSFTLSDVPANSEAITRRFGFPDSKLARAGHEFTLEKIAEATSELWAMGFLSDGRIVATQKNGALLVFDAQMRPSIVRGTPQVWNRGEGGLLDVQVHPDHMRNGWIYLAYSDPDAADNTMTAIVRGRIGKDLAWIDEQTIFKADASTYDGANSHFGSRIAFQDGYVYFSIGDRVQAELAQDLTSPFGKIHRLHDDGRVPKDNPYVRVNAALASIWSIGHRNPQGLTVHPHTGTLWSSEHGPMGGDEINIVRPGRNYGWPLVSFGRHYDGMIVSESPYREGVEPPLHQWTPSIGVSQIEFYVGDRLPAWRNSLIVASLGGQALHLLRIDGEKVVNDEVLFQGLGRIRDVVTGPDGHLYVAINDPNGTIYRIVNAAT